MIPSVARRVKKDKIHTAVLTYVMKCVTLLNMDAVIDKNRVAHTVKATDIVSWLLSNGINAAATEDLSGLIGVPANQVRQRMAPLLKRGEMVSPARGLWIPIPYEYRQWGAPEAISYIDSMMRYLDAEYYVGWMSAAAILGASHHAPQIFQVATSKAVTNRTIGRSNLRFYQRGNVESLPTFRHMTKSGFANVSTRAATMLSVASDPGIASGLDNAANIIIELSAAEEAFVGEIAACAGLFHISALRRLGWILDNYADAGDLDQLAAISSDSGIKLSKLSMHRAYSACIDRKWHLDINERISPDV